MISNDLIKMLHKEWVLPFSKVFEFYNNPPHLKKKDCLIKNKKEEERRRGKKRRSRKLISGIVEEDNSRGHFPWASNIISKAQSD